MVAVSAVLPQHPHHYHGNGSKFYGITVVWVQNMQESHGMGTRLAVLLWLWGWFYMDCELMHEMGVKE